MVKPMALNKKCKVTLVTNLIWFTFLLYGLGGAAYVRHTSPSYADATELRLMYDLIYLVGLGGLILLAILGIILRKKWGYSVSIIVNAVIPVLALGIFIIGIFMTDLQFGDVLRINANNLAGGFVSFCLLLSILTRDVKGYFQE